MEVCVKVEFGAGLATVKLDRPARRNAFSVDLMEQLIAAANELSLRHDIGAVVVTGGDEFFSAGADLKDERRWDTGSKTFVERRETARLGTRLARAWEEVPQITIAAIEGYAIGAGLALTLALDWRVMASNAFVSLPEIELGIPLTWGSIPRLTRLVGPAKAKRVTILCERIGAPDALAMGLIDYVAAPGAAAARAREVAQAVLAMPAHSVRMSKESVNVAANALNHAASFMAHDQFQLAMATEESRKARAAVLARKRS
ncbi:MAG TPA: enoyl-CoA hydratase/isomerase family protein [Burkholderiales bacterium]|nr:enoyl-CoA hydratase/isomerase family protein [Burkholderiales bacterium]